MKYTAFGLIDFDCTVYKLPAGYSYLGRAQNNQNFYPYSKVVSRVFQVSNFGLLKH